MSMILKIYQTIHQPQFSRSVTIVICLSPGAFVSFAREADKLDRLNPCIVIGEPFDGRKRIKDTNRQYREQLSR